MANRTFQYNSFASTDIAAGAQAVNRSSVAALTFFVWDILITLDDEIDLIWPPIHDRPLLLVGSELTPYFHFTPRDCYIWQVYQGVAMLVVVALTDIILLLRVNAMYNQQIVVRRTVTFLFLLEIVGMSTGLALALPGIQYDLLCVDTHVPLTIASYG
ncbi:hypothetical protein JR316_0002006 [Psilocybe cubensis]|uniref:Uncharacterized protein n=1 Tax=Psilocybe cubensis TaxID=181762 RepID=A0ACB8HBP5_PSICU|nr:hypothetical protein JR316_0002006 [Psilocybe cubensis]KAH9485099.1 hypothetical protein JR316_0002006 [Psilocybe cubensis]